MDLKANELPSEVQSLISHIKNWESLVSDDVTPILQKLWTGEELTRSENNVDVTPSELAAIWSVANRTPIKPEYVRQVKRDGRIVPSKEWGTGSGYRCLYRVRTVKDIKIGHDRGRPRKKKSAQENTEPQLSGANAPLAQERPWYLPEQEEKA